MSSRIEVPLDGGHVLTSNTLVLTDNDLAQLLVGFAIVTPWGLTVLRRLPASHGPDPILGPPAPTSRELYNAAREAGETVGDDWPTGAPAPERPPP